MNVVRTSLEGIIIIEPQVFEDNRGYFVESYQADRYQEAGIPESFVQDNLALSDPASPGQAGTGGYRRNLRCGSRYQTRLKDIRAMGRGASIRGK